MGLNIELILRMICNLFWIKEFLRVVLAPGRDFFILINHRTIEGVL